MDTNLEILSHRDENSKTSAEFPDWKLIDEISIMLLELGVGRFDTLQQALPSIVFANIQRIRETSEDNNKSPHRDPYACSSVRLLKMFRIAQFQLEHLLRSQHELLDSLDEERQRRKKLANENRLLKRSALSARRRGGGASSRPIELFKCNACSKIFMNSVFLYEHLQRRHANGATATQPNPIAPCRLGALTDMPYDAPANCDYAECGRHATRRSARHPEPCSSRGLSSDSLQSTSISGR